MITLHEDQYTFFHRVFSSYQINAHFFYSITIYMFHYEPRYVSSSTLLIFRRTNCIITASGIVTFCKRHTVRPFTESDDTRGCNNAICPPEDEQGTARNISRFIMKHIYCYRIKEVCIKLVT